MKKLKNLTNKMVNALKNLLKKMPVTLITIFIFTVFAAITFDMDVSKFKNENTLQIIYSFLALFTLISLFIETAYDFKKKSIKFISYVVNLAITSIFVYVFYTSKEYLFGFSINFVQERMGLFLYGLASICILTALYKMYRKSTLNFNEYVYTVVAGSLKIMAFDFVISLGVAIIYFLFKALIFSSLDPVFYSRIIILVQGIFFLPAILKVFFNDGQKESSTFFKVLNLYIVLPLYGFISAILYIYIVKLFIQKEIPSNFIYPVVAAIFIAGFFLFNFLRNHKEIKFIDKVTKILPFYLIPLIILQIYAVIVRFLGYGITISRYITYMFLAFEIITILLMIIKKSEKIYLSIVVFMILSVIATLTPFNMVTVSNNNQNSRIEKYMKMDTNEMTSEQMEAFEGAYDYLKEQTNKEKYITVDVENKMKEIKSLSAKNEDNKDNSNLSARQKIYYNKTLGNYDDTINIAGYSTMKEFKYSYNDDYEKAESSEYDEAMKKIVNELINVKENDRTSVADYLEKIDYTFKIDDKQVLRINKISAYYRKSSDINSNEFSIEYISCNGYLLRK